MVTNSCAPIVHGTTLESNSGLSSSLWGIIEIESKLPVAKPPEVQRFRSRTRALCAVDGEAMTFSSFVQTSRGAGAKIDASGKPDEPAQVEFENHSTSRPCVTFPARPAERGMTKPERT
jgi:hypothetical protein